MSKIFLLTSFSFLMFIIPGQLISQELSNQRRALINTRNDTIKYDSLSTVAGSTQLLDSNNNIIPDTSYSLLPWKSMIIPGNQLKKEYTKLILEYRVMPETFSSKYFHKNIEKIRRIPSNVFTYKKLSGKNGSSENIFQAGRIIQSGSISRGLTMGNNQDAVVNSGMDLQLSGKLNDNLNIVGAISDKNIPIQADGTTQKIRDLDRVYVKVYNESTTLKGGDFRISDPGGYFMKLDKKVQGAGGTHHYSLGSGNQSTSSISGAISKGKYCTRSFRGEEGNQGPYKLTGCNNEAHIIILSGSERVFIDGERLERGKNNDYTINYNTAEITFTSNQPITKDKRIRIEFEYSLNEYARFTAFTHNTIKTDKGRFWINAFSQHDSKNQTLAQQLTQDQKDLLYSIGDDLDKAVVPSVDTGNYRDDRILYIKKDTLINGEKFTLYQYSTNPQKARYKVGFSYVGKNNGNYMPVKSAANGRVYEWVAPVNGAPQGSYSPIKTLLTPKKQQFITFGAEGQLSPSTSSFFEMALSNNDLNTFSPKDQQNNKGYAMKLSVDKVFAFDDTSRNQLESSVSYRGIHRNFSALERFKAVEFERNWNLRPEKLSGNEHLLAGEIDFRNHKMGKSSYQFEYLSYTGGYQGYRNHLNADLEHSGFEFLFSGSLLNTTGEGLNTKFLRYRTDLGRRFNQFKIGVKNSAEYNKWQADSLMSNSFSFNQWEFYLTNPDTATNHYYLNYQIREDKDPLNNQLQPSTLGKDLNLGLNIHSISNNSFKARITYRQLDIKHNRLTDTKPQDNLIGRIEHNARLFNNFLTTSTSFEVASGLEPRREFTYIEVPAGQGAYTWTDYNENKIKELDEFEKANFADQANYIRVYRPSGEYFKTHTNELNEIINLNPGRIIRDTSTFKKILAKFTDQIAFTSKRKTKQTNLWESLNPFAYEIKNPLVISQHSNMRNTLSFNKNSPEYTVDYILRKSENKMLLMNGTEIKRNKNQAIHATWNITPAFVAINKSGIQKESHKSEYFQNKNYRIRSIKESISLRYTPYSSFRLEVDYTFSDMKNLTGREKAIKHQIGTQLHYSKKKKFRIQGEIDYIHYQYDFSENTPIAYQMLEGLKPGRNGTWSLIFQKDIYKNLELNLNYSGRVSQKHSAIHTGQVELRASF